MEAGYVKFFDTRDGKLFGFVVDGKGAELFFHYSGGCRVALDANQDIVFEPMPPRYPKKGDRLMFARGRNAKGVKASTWWFERDYENVVEKRKRELTLGEVKQTLGGATANVLAYKRVVRGSWDTMTIETSEITWSKGSQTLAVGTFARIFHRYEGGDRDVLRETTARVSMYSPDPQKYHKTEVEGADAESLEELGRRVIRRGVYVSVLWNGGCDAMVVDPATVREITAEERAATGPYGPWLGDSWLKCSFARHLGGENEVVKVIAYLGGHD